jgi:hypothetical protein
MNESLILNRVSALVDRQHELRDLRQRGLLGREQEQLEIRQLEEAVDQCWALVRQRRAAETYGLDPTGPAVTAAPRRIR